LVEIKKRVIFVKQNQKSEYKKRVANEQPHKLKYCSLAVSFGWL